MASSSVYWMLHSFWLLLELATLSRTRAAMTSQSSSVRPHCTACDTSPQPWAVNLQRRSKKACMITVHVNLCNYHHHYQEGYAA